MILQKTLDKLYSCMDSADIYGFEKHIKAYLKTTDEASASQDLAMFIVTEYTAAKADALAELMKIIIKCNPKLALINYPENHFFKICIVSGSLTLFKCFMQQAIEPHLQNLSEKEYKEYYKVLLHCGAQFNTLFSDQYEPQIKGLHFNGAFSTDDGIVSINEEDYNSMVDIVDIYNTIIGRRDIIKLMLVKAGMPF